MFDSERSAQDGWSLLIESMSEFQLQIEQEERDVPGYLRVKPEIENQELRQTFVFLSIC